MGLVHSARRMAASVGRRSFSRRGRNGSPDRRARRDALAETLESRTLLAAATWLGGSGDWTDATKWSIGRAPVYGDDVTIPDGSVTVSTAGQRANTVNGAGALVIATGGNLYLDTGGAAQDLTVSGGTFRSGTFQVNGAMNFTAGTVDADAPLKIAGTLAVSGDAIKSFTGTVTLTGTATHADAGTLSIQNFTIAPGAVYDLTSDADLAGANFTTLTLRGTLRKSGGSGESLHSGLYDNLVIDGGTIEAQSGTLRFETLQGISTGGTFNAAAGATVRFEGNDARWDGTYTGGGAGRVELAGNFGVYTKPLAFDFAAGTLHWVAGQLAAGGANYPVTNLGHFQISGPGDKSFYSEPFVNAGTVVHSGGKLSSGRIVNESGGLWEMQDGVTRPDGAFDNRGTLRKTGSGEASFSTAQAQLNHLGGIVEAQGGTLRVLGGSTSTGGTFNASAGATLRFENNGARWDGTYSGSGAGRVELAGSFGVYTKPLAFDFAAGTLHWVAGQLAAGGVNYPVTNLGHLQISGPANKDIYSEPFINTGTVVHSGGKLTNGTVENQTGGIWEMQDGAERVDGAFNNRGTLRKTGSGEASFSTANTQLHHLGGTVDVQGGTLKSVGSGNGTGGTFNVATGATFDITGPDAAQYWNGTFGGSGGGRVLFDSGILGVNQSTGTDPLLLSFPDGLFVVTGGYFSSPVDRPWTNNGFVTFGPTGAASFAGTFVNNGTIRHAGDFASNGNTLLNKPGAVYEMTGAGDLTWGDFQNSGTFRKSGDGVAKGLTNNNVFKHDGSGAIEVTGGTMRFTRSIMTGSETFDVSAGAVLEFGSYNEFKAGTYGNNGTGIVRFNGAIFGTNDEGPYAVMNFTGNSLQIAGGQLLDHLEFAGQTNFVSNADVFNRSDGEIRNSGTWIHSGNGRLLPYLTTTFVNSGLYDLQSDAGMNMSGVYGYGGAEPGFRNTPTGILRKSGGTGVSKFEDTNDYALMTFDNQGTVEVLTGTLQLPENTVQLNQATYNSPIRLSAGTWVVRPFAALEILGNKNVSGEKPAIAANEANVTLDGPGSTFAQLNSFSTNAGAFTVTGGRDFTTAGNLTNTGTLRAGPGSTVTVNGTLDTSGTVEFVLNGTNASGEFGQVNATGPATLAGTAALTLAQGFAPAGGDNYTLMTFPSRTGTFATIAGGADTFEPVLGPTSFTTRATGTTVPADLRGDAPSITIPTTATLGQPLPVSYSVTNLGGAASGDWNDSLYLSRDTTFDPADVLLGRVQHAGGLAAGATYTSSVSLPTPGVPDDKFYIIVIADSGRAVPETDRANNTAASATTLDTAAPVLEFDQTVSGTIAEGQSIYYRLPFPGDTDSRLDATFDVSLAAELYVAAGRLPTRSDWDWTASDLYELNRRIDLSLAAADDYYILVYGREGASAGANYTLRAQQVAVEIQSVGPTTLAASGMGTLRIDGLGFNTGTTAALVRPDGGVVNAGINFIESTTALYATFDLTGMPAGGYGVRVTRADGNTFTLASAVTVTPAAQAGHVFTTLATPGSIRQGRGFEFTVEYGNDGQSDVVAPWLTISVSGGTRWNLKGQPSIQARHWDILGTSPDGPAGVLRPGQRVRLTFEAVWESEGEPLIQIWGATDRQRLTANDMIELYGGTPGRAPWDAVAGELARRYGSTVASYNAELARLASRTGQLGSKERDVVSLVKLGVLDAMIDVATPSAPRAAQAARGDVATFATGPGDEAYVEYSTDPSTNGIGSRLPDGRWVPYQPAREPTFLEMVEYEGQVQINKSIVSGVFFLREEWSQWIAQWLEGSGQPWVADFSSRLAKEMIQYIHVTTTQTQSQVFDRMNDQITFQQGPFADIPIGRSTAHYFPPEQPQGVDVAPYTLPTPGDVKWSFGGTSLSPGRSPAGTWLGWDVDLERYQFSEAGDKVYWQANDIPMRIDDNFTIDEHVVNIASKYPAGSDAYKGDPVSFYMPFYMLQTFGKAKATKWIVNMVLPHAEGTVVLAGVEAKAGDDQTYYVPQGESSVSVSLNADAEFIKANQLKPEEGATFTWTGLQANPEDVQFAKLDLTPGSYVFVLKVRGKSDKINDLPAGAITYEDLDTVTVRVLDEKDKPTPEPQSQRPRRVASSDPNDITGPAGYGPGNHVTLQQSFPYTIRFENQKSATAAAQEVFITEQLDADLDWSTFELGSFGFGSLKFDIPQGRQNFQQRIDLRSTLGLFVDLDAGIDLSTGKVHWTFRAIDPNTGDLVSDALAGFLPANVTSPEGEGFANYFIRQKAGLASGATVDAQARIVFDLNAPIDTNVFTNIIDAAGPASAVTAMPATTGSASFLVSWAGADEAGGSGVARYDVFVSTNGGDYTLFRDDTTETSATFAGQPGHTYAFYSVATDNVGHREAAPSSPDAQTTTAAEEPPALSINDVRWVEGTHAGFSVFKFTVTRDGADLALRSTVAWEVAHTGTATPDDAPPRRGAVTFRPGETRKSIVAWVRGDKVVEADETFHVNLSRPTNATIADGQGLGTIVNDDGLRPPPRLSINDVRRSEGRSGRTAFTFTVRRSGDLRLASSVAWATEFGSASSADLAAQSGTLTFATGLALRTLTVWVNGDRARERHETFLVNLSGAVDATISDGRGVGTILNDD